MRPKISNECFYLWLVLLLAFGTRLTGVGFGLPDVFHQDEPIVVNHALAYADGDLNPHFFKIPPLLSYLLFIVYGFVFIVLKIFAHYSKDQFALLFFKDPTLLYLSGRVIFGVCLGTASVYVLYRIAKKIFDVRTALTAAFLFSVSYLHARDSHYLYTDIPMIFAMLMSLEAFCCYQESQDLSKLVWASFWAGVSIAFKYIAAPIIFPIAIGLVIPVDKNKRAGTSSFKCLLLSAGLIVTVYSLLNPFQWINFSFFLDEIRIQSFSEGRMPIFHHLTYSLVNGLGWPTVGLGIIGIFLACIRTPRTFWLWTLPMIYYGMITLFSQPYERYAMPIVPFLCLAAAFVMNRLAESARTKRLKTIAWIVLVLIVAFFPLQKLIYLDRMLLKEDTRTVAKKWIGAHVSESAVVVLDHPFFSPRLNQTKEQLTAKLSLVAPEDPHADSKIKKINWMIRAGLGKPGYRVFYVDANLLDKVPFLNWSPVLKADQESLERIHAEYYVRYRFEGDDPMFQKEIAPHAELVQTVSPYRDKAKRWSLDHWAYVALPYEDPELFSRNRPGPYLEIYKLIWNS